MNGCPLVSPSVSVQNLLIMSVLLLHLAEEIEKKLTAYRRGSRFWRMLIFCQVQTELHCLLLD